MQPPSAGVWVRAPGYESSDTSDGETSERSDRLGQVSDMEDRLQQVLAELGDRWVDVPLHRFVPADISKSSNWNSARVPTSLTSKISQACAQAAGPQGSSFRMEGTYAPLVRETMLANGLHPTLREDWMVHWSGPRVSNVTFTQLDECQRLNHFPGSTELTDKDRLWAHFRHMKEKFGSAAFDFVPESFVLPSELHEFVECYKRRGGLWIVKKTNGSCGRGVYILRDLQDLPQGDQVWVVSRYINDPMLIQGLKFDLRIYVLVTGYDPLCAYVYREGLARFASRAYSVANEHLKDKLRHLTNYSINKAAANFVENQDVCADNYGHKWSLSALNKHLRCTGVNTDLMWSRIMDLIVKTLLAVEPAIRSKSRQIGADISGCFELYGFDVLVDSALKPWLLEVNLSPSMSTESPLDWKVKSSLLSDTLNLVGVCRGDLEAIRKQRWRLHQVQARRAAMGIGGVPKARVSTNRPSVHKSPFRSRGSGPVVRAKGTCPRLRRKKRQSGAALSKSCEADKCEWHPVMLDTLGVGQLKMLTRRLRERRRSHNFLLLYPTCATVARYGPITDAREPWPSVGDDAFYRGCQLSAAQLLCSVLYGPRPCYSMNASSKLGLPNRRRTPVSLSNALQSERQMELAEKSIYGPSMARQRFAQAILNLGRTGYFLLVWMEYLLRVANVCDVLSSWQRAQLAQSSAYSKLVAFRFKLCRLLTGTSTSTCIGGHEAPSTDSGEHLGFLDELASTCKEFVACLGIFMRGQAVDLFATVTSGSLGAAHQNPNTCDGSLTLQQYLPPTVLESAFLSESAASIQTLRTGEIERLIQSSEAASILRNLLQPVKVFASDFATIKKASTASEALNFFAFEGKHFELGPLGELLAVSFDLSCRQSTTDHALKRTKSLYSAAGPRRNQDTCPFVLKVPTQRSKSSSHPMSTSLPVLDEWKVKQLSIQQDQAKRIASFSHPEGASFGIRL